MKGSVFKIIMSDLLTKIKDDTDVKVGITYDEQTQLDDVSQLYLNDDNQFIIGNAYYTPPPLTSNIFTIPDESTYIPGSIAGLDDVFCALQALGRSRVNFLVDVSASMQGKRMGELLGWIVDCFDSVNLIQVDRDVRAIDLVHNRSQLRASLVNYEFGTIMQPGIDAIREQFAEYDTVFLTDGLTEELDLTGLRGNMLILTTYYHTPIKLTPEGLSVYHFNIEALYETE